MALIVEDGTGLAIAESYISVAGATAYHAARGNAAWAALVDDVAREQLLRKATDYMRVYRLRWAGYRVYVAQALDWPRQQVPVPDAFGWGLSATVSYFANNVVPRDVANACAELALRASTADLAPDLDRVKSREKVDVIEVEYEKSQAPWVRFRAVDVMLAPYLLPTTMEIPLVRG